MENYIFIKFIDNYTSTIKISNDKIISECKSSRVKKIDYYIIVLLNKALIYKVDLSQIIPCFQITICKKSYPGSYKRIHYKPIVNNNHRFNMLYLYYRYICIMFSMKLYKTYFLCGTNIYKCKIFNTMSKYKLVGFI
jgi:hypothetical protein